MIKSEDLDIEIFADGSQRTGMLEMQANSLIRDLTTSPSIIRQSQPPRLCGCGYATAPVDSLGDCGVMSGVRRLCTDTLRGGGPPYAHTN
jgi:hypothetical protein